MCWSMYCKARNARCALMMVSSGAQSFLLQTVTRREPRAAGHQGTVFPPPRPPSSPCFHIPYMQQKPQVYPGATPTLTPRSLRVLQTRSSWPWRGPLFSASLETRSGVVVAFIGQHHAAEESWLRAQDEPWLPPELELPPGWG